MSCDPLRVFLDQHAASTHVLYSSRDVQATLYTLRGGTQLVLKITSEGRADFEWRQVSNEVKAARSLPDCSCLGHQVAWKEAADGSMLSVSLYAGRTVEALLQGPAAHGGWADLALWQRVEVARDVLAGGVHALLRMRPWLHFDVKPANVSFMACTAGGPPHITLLDMGAVTHIAALHTPQRSTLYPVVSTDHMDVALITLQPGQAQLPYETKQGCRDALSPNTDVFTLGLLAYKILLGPHLPPDMDWDSRLYEPWGTMQEQQYVAAQQRLARDLTRGISSHPRTHTMLKQLPQDCRHALARMCDPNPASRANIQEVSQLPYIQQQVAQLGINSVVRDADYADARQRVINLLQDVPGIQLAARPGRLSRHSNSSSAPDLTRAASLSCTSRASFSSNCLQQLEGEGVQPPGAWPRLPKGTNAARPEAAAGPAALHNYAPQGCQDHQQRCQQQRQQHQCQHRSDAPIDSRPTGPFGQRFDNATQYRTSPLFTPSSAGQQQQNNDGQHQDQQQQDGSTAPCRFHKQQQQQCGTSVLSKQAAIAAGGTSWARSQADQQQQQQDGTVLNLGPRPAGYLNSQRHWSEGGQKGLQGFGSCCDSMCRRGTSHDGYGARAGQHQQ